MMNSPQRWFDAVFVINLARRTDRWESIRGVLARLDLDRFDFEPEPRVFRFDAYADLVDHTGKVNGNLGCTSSHRAVLELIAFHKYERALVLEDDSMIRRVVMPNFLSNFDTITNQLPADWRMLYLGGSYGENPKRRYSSHLIETNAVMTTSSYVINWRQARRMAPDISGIGPIDSLYHKFNREGGCFMAYPRLFVQKPGFSDLTERESENTTSMEDEAHEDMLLTGKWQGHSEPPDTPPKFGRLHGHVQRREISDPRQLNGSQVIVNGTLFTVISIELPAQFPPRPWFRGCPCVYNLTTRVLPQNDT